jgi:hypothetical protein
VVAGTVLVAAGTASVVAATASEAAEDLEAVIEMAADTEVVAIDLAAAMVEAEIATAGTERGIVPHRTSITVRNRAASN